MRSVFLDSFRANIDRVRSPERQSMSLDRTTIGDFDKSLQEAQKESLEAAQNKAIEKEFYSQSGANDGNPSGVTTSHQQFVANRINEIVSQTLTSVAQPSEQAGNAQTAGVTPSPTNTVKSEAAKVPGVPVIKDVRWTAERVYSETTQVPAHIESSANHITGKKTAQVKDIITKAGERHGVDPYLSLALAQVESGLNVHAIGTDGHASKGIFQLLDSTGMEMHDRIGASDNYDPFNPSQNAHLGVGYMRHLLDIFSEETALNSSLKTAPANSSGELEKLALAAFNSGQGTVARAQKKAQEAGHDPGEYNSLSPYLPATTRTYVERITQLRKALEEIA